MLVWNFAELISFADMVPGSPPKDGHSVSLGPDGGQWCCAAPVDLGWIYLISKKQAFVPLSLLRFEEDSFKQHNLVYHDRFIYQPLKKCVNWPINGVAIWHGIQLKTSSLRHLYHLMRMKTEKLSLLVMIYFIRISFFLLHNYI